MPLLLLLKVTGVGAGVGDNIGGCDVETGTVVNLGSAPVPRTQASGAVHWPNVLNGTVFPTESHEPLAACTMESRSVFNPLCKEVVP